MGLFKRKGDKPWRVVSTGHLADDQLRQARQHPGTGHWACNRCGDTWNTRRPIPEDWNRQKEGPHVCPSCGSYAFTYPTN